MKKVRSALALVLSVSMALLAPGGTAWAQVAQTVAAPAPVSVGGSAASAAGAMNRGASAPVGLAPALSLTTLAPAFSAPAAMIPSGSAPAASVAPAAAAVLPAAAASAVISAAAAPAAPADADAQPGAAPSFAHASVSPGSVRADAPATGAWESARRNDLPDFSKLSAGDSKGAAADDFLSRIGGFFRSARTRSSALAADGAIGRSAAPLIRRQASASGSPEVSAVERASARPARLDGASGNAAGAFALGSAAGTTIVHFIASMPLVFAALIGHELGHTTMAKALGDPTATRQGRASFSPLTWHRHVDPFGTIVLPIATFFMTGGHYFGFAKGAPFDASRFKRVGPRLGTVLVALAGPAASGVMAVLGSFAYAGAAAAGLGPIVLGALASFVFANVVIALLNLMPLPPLDGGHVLMALLPHRVADAVNGFYAKIGIFGMLPIALIALFAGGGFILAAAGGLTHMLIGATFAVTGVQLASAALPAIAALGMAIGSIVKTPAGVGQLTAAAAPPSGPTVPGEASGDGEGRPVDLVVLFSPRKSIAKDLHLTAADPRGFDYVRAYEGLQSGLLGEMKTVGVTPETLASYNASPIASYRRINAATIRVDASKAAEFEAALIAAGHKVYPNDRRKIVIPRPVVPEDADPASRNPIGMAENLRITGADKVQAVLAKRFGAPDLNPWQKAVRAVKGAFGAAEEAPQPSIAVVDSGADTTHPLLKRVKAVVNETAGAAVDDIGHGSWVTSMVLNYAPWAKNLTHYKTFQGGGANLDDILKALTAAANDGNLVISNSWGSDDGDPESPDSLLVKKLASEGHMMVFAAGNAGPGANTVGSPAIVQFKDPATGAIRVIAVAATDRNKKVASFSSRGPGSPKTAGKDGFAHRPDAATLGANTEGAWPAALGDADRTDPQLGPLKSISGTSMATPGFAGAIALLLIAFGVTGKGAKLDAVVNALMATLVKTGKNGVDDEGQGFLNVEAAYETLYKQFNPGGIPPTAVARYRALKSALDAAHDQLTNPGDRSVLGGDMSIPPMDRRIVESLADEAGSYSREMRALEAEYPGIAHHAAGPLARAWADLTGRAPRSAAAEEYRRLSAKIRDNDARRKDYMDRLPGDLGVREELLEIYFTTMAPKFEADAAALGEFLRTHPNAEYEAAGPITRLFLRLTGRGPQA